MSSLKTVYFLDSWLYVVIIIIILIYCVLLLVKAILF